MALRLKTHTKVLLALAVVSMVGAASWQLGLKNLLSNQEERVSQGSDPKSPSVAAPPVGAVGTSTAPLKVSIVSWHGYAPALVANGNSLKTKADSLFSKEGLSVEFLLQDDIPPLAQNFSSGVAHCSWRTIDFFAQEHPGLRENKLDAKVIMVVDNSTGSDAILAKTDVKSVEDLAGKRIGLVQYTPSHMVLLHAIEQSSLTARKKETIKFSFINGGPPEVRAAFEAGQIDAAVLWEPDTSLALKKSPDTHIVFSTKTATNLIYDVMVCDSRVIASSPDAIQKFVNGWMKGVKVTEENPSLATEALVATEPMFDELLKREGKAYVESLYSGVAWTGLDDNLRILGLADGPNFAERVYAQSDKIWRENTELIAKETPVILPSEAFDLSFIRKLAETDASAKESAKKPEYTFSETERKEALAAAPAQLTKPVSINFSPGSSELSKRALKVIDDEVVPLLDAMGSAYFSVEGNTDKTGSGSINQKLSAQRAEAVVAYLVKEWEYPRERFKVSGNGSQKPRCTDASAEGVAEDECLGMNRRTDIAVYSR